MSLWLIMMRHHTKICNKMFASSEDIIRKNTNILNLCCDLDLDQWFECSHPIFIHRTLQLVIMYHQSKYGCKQISRLDDIVKTVTL